MSGTFHKTQGSLPLNQNRSAQELKQNATSLIAEYEFLKKQNEQLLQMASLTAHQLKTPLMSLIWQTEIIKENLYAHPQNSFPDGLEKIAYCARQIKQQFEDILGYSLQVPGTAKSSIRGIIDSIFRTINSTRKITLMISEEGKPRSFDRFVIHTILQNLIINGLEYTPTEPVEFNLCIKYCENKVHISYGDNSPGIPSAIWRKAGAINKLKGRGLGLMLIRQITLKEKIKIYREKQASNRLHIELEI